MKSKKIAIILIIAAVLAGVIYYIVKEKEGNGYITLYGNVDVRIVDLGFRVFGKLTKLHFEEGDFIRPGDVLAELDPIPYQENLKQAQAQVQSNISLYKSANVLYKRREELVGSNSVSKQEYDDALYSRDTSLSNLNQAEAARASAQISLDDTKLISLVSGTIQTRVREPGTILKVGDTVFVAALETPLWIRAYASEPDLGKIYPGMEAEIYTDTKTNPVYKGKIGFISSVAEFTPKNVETTDLRTDLVYQLRIYVEEHKGLLQGMPVTVKLRVQ